MSTDLVPTQNVAALDKLDPAAREIAVTRMLTEARSWLAHAVEASEPARIAEFKAFVATIAETTKQLSLSKAIQVDALAMVRRAERGVGIAIRRGQERGDVETTAEARRRATTQREVNQGRADQNVLNGLMKPRPSDFASISELSPGTNQPGIYDLADGVSDEQFEEALAAAKAESNVSRANVVRKIKRQPAPAMRPEILRKKRRISAERVITETIAALDGLAIGLSYVDNLAAIEPAQAAEWSAALTAALRPVSRFAKELHRAATS